MPNKGPVGFARFTSLFMNLVIGIVLGVLFLFLTHDLGTMPPDEIARCFCQSLIMSVLVGYAAADFLPSMQIAQRICDSFKVKSSAARHLITSTVLALVNITVILTLCMFIALLAIMSPSDVIAIIVSLWVPAVVVGFLAILVFLPLAQWLAAKISGFSPASE